MNLNPLDHGTPKQNAAYAALCKNSNGIGISDFYCWHGGRRKGTAKMRRRWHYWRKHCYKVGVFL